MKKHLYFLPFLLLGCAITKQISVSDLTPEHSFTTNCEGPNVDKAGNLFVVNYEKDGTVGIITPEGKASKWIDLPNSGDFGFI